MKKIAIITFHNAINYGAILQCFALQNFIRREFDCTVKVIDYCPDFFKKAFYDPAKPWTAYGVKSKIKAFLKKVLFYTEVKKLSRKHALLYEFIKKNIDTVPFTSEVGKDFDIYITGSDQVWNLKMVNGDTTYLLDFVHNGIKLSYAASFKIENIDSYALNNYKKNLSTFKAISVREQNLQVFLDKELNLYSSVVLDPTLLIGRKFWNKRVYDKSILRNKYLLIYYVNPPDMLLRYAFSYAKKNGLNVVSLNHIRNYNDYIDFSDASIDEFINLVAYAEVIFTTSFHGMAFSIIFEKAFFYEIPEKSGNNNARLISLANKLGLENRNIAKCDFESKIRWEKVNINLEKEINNSSVFLRNTII